jgi:pimeloyl-ACP methyl ester carboxylesterase
MMGDAGNKTLIVFPGGGSPSTPLYAEVFSLIRQGAMKYGYSSVDLSVRWLGHIEGDQDNTPPLTLPSAVETAAGYLSKYDEAGAPYDILARSFGTYVALRSAATFRPKNLGRMILWGPPPFWRLWELFVRDLDANLEMCRQKGLSIGTSFFPTLVPFESLLCEVTYPVVIASGTKDKYSTPADILYLEALAGGKKNVSFRRVEGAIHEVTAESPPEIVDSYVSELFR